MHDEEAWETQGEHEGRRHRHGGRSRVRMAARPGPAARAGAEDGGPDGALRAWDVVR